MTSYVLCKTGSLAVFKVTARDQGHYKGPSGAFVTYYNISCFSLSFFLFLADCLYLTKLLKEPLNPKQKTTKLLNLADILICFNFGIVLPGNKIVNFVFFVIF